MPGLSGETGLSGLSGEFGGATYISKVLGYSPIAYWPLYEASGTTAACLVNSAQNGTYSSDVSGWPVGDGIGDGNTSPSFDGTNDYVNVDTATLVSNWDGTTGSLIIWGKVNAAGVWTDGATRDYCIFTTDGSNISYFRKNAANNQHRWRFTAGGSGALFNRAETTTDWHCMQMSWGGGNNNYYFDGSFIDGPNNIGVWAGALGTAVIGAVNTTPAEAWHGSLAHCALFPSVLTQPQFADLATV